jgi:lipid A 3-O-deacylase
MKRRKSRESFRQAGVSDVAKFAANAAVGMVVAIAAPFAALAADLPNSYTDGVTPDAPAPVFTDWEVRGGVYAHDFLSPEKGSADINAEVLAPRLWQSPDPFWSIFIPHPDFGTTINTVGKTSNLWGGVAWNYDITQNIFFSPTFGVGVNDGKAGDTVPRGWNAVGCNWWFHESASIGYRLTANWSIMASVEHSSNAGFCVQNRGLTNTGLRLGYRF